MEWTQGEFATLRSEKEKAGTGFCRETGFKDMFKRSEREK